MYFSCVMCLVPYDFKQQQQQQKLHSINCTAPAKNKRKIIVVVLHCYNLIKLKHLRCVCIAIIISFESKWTSFSPLCAKHKKNNKNAQIKWILTTNCFYQTYKLYIYDMIRSFTNFKMQENVTQNCSVLLFYNDAFKLSIFLFYFY